MALTRALKDIVNKIRKKDDPAGVNASVNIINTGNNLKTVIQNLIQDPKTHLKNFSNNIKQDKKRALPLLAGILMILLPIAYLTIQNLQTVEAAWFNEDWTFRKKVIVTNNTTQETDVYIQFDGDTQFIDTSDTTKWQTDCDDLRFTDYNGRILKHYIVSDCGTSSTVVQVYFDTFIAGKQTIYYYYGNPSVTTGSENSAFSTEATNYSIGAAGSEEITTGPVGYWKFDEGYGTNVRDSTVHGNDGTALGSTEQNPSIEQQLNIIDKETTTVGTDIGIVAIDTSNYTSATYYFEVVAKVTSGTGTTALTYNAGTGAEPTGGTTVPITNITDTSYTRYRSASFTPSGDQNAYVSDISGTGTTLKAARVIIVQSAPSIPDTEIQIEVGNNESTTETSATTLTNPKIFKYDDDGYSGTVNAYFEATIRASTIAGTFNTSATYPGTVTTYADTTNGYDNNDWTNPTDIIGNDSNNAYINSPTFDSPDYSYVIRARNFGFSGISPSASIAGIKVVIDRYYANGTVSDVLIQLSYNNAGDETDRFGNNKGGNSWTTFETPITSGANDDLWGATLNASTIQNANFGVDIAVQATGSNSDAFIDYVTMQVFYSGEQTETAYAQLYNKTNSAVVTNSAISSNSNTWQRVRGASALTTNWDTTNDDEYYVRIYTSNSEAPVYISNAKIILDQNQAGGILDTQMFHMYNNTASTDSDGTYSSKEFMNLYDPSNIISSGTFAGYFESTLKTSNASNAYYAQLDIPAGEVTGSDTSPALKTSSDIYSSLPSSATNVDVQLKNNSTDTSTSTGSWLKLQATTLGGTAQVDPTWKTADDCVSGNCMEYDGSNSVTTVTNANAIDLDQYLSTGVTFQAWIRAYSDGESNLGEIFSKGNDTFMKVSNEGADGLMDLEVSLDLASSNAAGTFPNAISINEWHHVSMGYTDDGNDELTVYVDGKSVGSTSNGSGAPSSDSNDLLIGGSSSYNFDGVIDDFKIYPYERTAGEVKNDHVARGTGEGSAVRLGPDQGVLTKGLIGHWKMDDGSGTDVTDSSGFGNTGTFGAGDSAPSWSTGHFGKGLDYDGSSDYVEINNDYNFENTNQFTFATWVKFDSIAGWQSFLGQDTTDWTDQYAAFYFQKSDNSTACGRTPYAFTFLIPYSTGSCTLYMAQSTTTATTDTWYHVAATYDQEKLRIYVNGVLEGETELTASLATQTGNLNIGSSFWNNVPADFVNGQMDDVRIYNRALNTPEIQQLYKWAPQPILYLNFDEGSGTSRIEDSSGNGNYATLSGFTESSWERGQFGKSLYFDGTSTVATVANESAFDFERTDAFSISSWVRVVGDNAEQKIFNKMDNSAPNRGYEFFVTNTNKLAGYLISTWSGDAIYVFGTTDVNDDSWHHVEMTYDGTSTAPGVKIYLDGQEESLTYNNDSLQNTMLTDISPNIGKRNAGSLYFEGNIDELKVYDYERTQEQVIEDMNAGHPAPGSPVGSPIAWWKFDEGYGDTANDSSQMGNDLDLGGSAEDCSDGGTGCPEWSNSGKFNKALSFEGGVDDTAEILDSNLSDGFVGKSSSTTEDFTISAWVNLNNYTDRNPIVSKQSDFASPKRGFVIASGSGSGKIFFEIWKNDSTNTTIQTSSEVPIGEWHHVTTTYDYISDGTSVMKIYIDGKLNIESSSAVGPLQSNDDGLEIGRYGWSAAYRKVMDGLIDEVKIYNFAFTAGQVAAEYNQGKAAVFGAGTTAGGSEPSYSAGREYCPPGDSTSTCGAPIIAYTFDEKSGQYAYDRSGGNNNGTFGSGATADSADPTWVHSGNCVEGNCIDFDGGDYVQAPTTGMSTSQGTVSVRFYYVYVGGDWQLIYSHRNSGGSRIYVGVDSSGDKNLWTRLGGSGDELSVVVSENEWHHAALTWDSGSFTTFFDGRQVDSGSYSSLSSLASCGLIGADNNTCGSFGALNQHFEGMVDTFYIYDYARTPAQIAWEYNKGAPIGWWKFDECQGTTAYDSSGNGNDGTITPGAGTNTSAGTCDSGTGTEMWDNGTTGKIGASLDFDGIDDYVTQTDSTDSVFDVNNITISAWVNYDNIPNTYARIVDKQASYVLNLAQSNSSPSLTFYGLSEQNLSGNSLLNTGEWYHITATYDGGNINLYIDGKLDATTTSTGTITKNDNPIHFGDQTGSGREFDGQIDEIKIFNYGMTPEQVRQNYNSGAVRFD